jgi:hypothetical protein
VWKSKLVVLGLVLFVAYLGCRSDPSVPDYKATNQDDNGSGRTVLDECTGSQTCDTETCISDWFDDYCRTCTLTVEEDTYTFTQVKELDNGEFNLFGNIDNDKPVLEWEGPSGTDNGDFFVNSPIGLEVGYSTIRDIDFHFGVMGNHNKLMKFYNCAMNFENVDIVSENCGYIIFSFNQDAVIIDDLYLSNVCTLYADGGFPSGTTIKNSDIQGAIKSCNAGASSPQVALRGNQLQDLRILGSGYDTYNLAQNNFFDTDDATVEMSGYSTVVADSNTTLRGPCKSQAEGDFSVGPNATLTLNSWRYQGTMHCYPEITNINSSRDGNTVTVTWDTEDCSCSSKVIYGYSPSELSDSATGIAGTYHSVSFSAGSTEGCVYYKAISANPGCSCDADTSDCEVDVEDVVISNINTFFNPFLCRMQVTWTTNVKSSSKVYYGTSCTRLIYDATGTGDTTSHSVVCDVSELTDNFAFKVESSSPCGDTETSSCQNEQKGSCF